MGESGISLFTAADYVVFSLMLAVSLGIGLYHALRGNKTTEDFLLASRSMKPVPVAMSLVATYISSISILGYVGEVYGHGMQMVWVLLGMVVGIVLTTHTIIPVFYSLKLRSINEYIEMRFHSLLLKRLILGISCLNMLLYLGLCLYAPTLALASVTPLSSNTYVAILGLVVTLYSSFGGLKAVVWTDVFQSVIIMSGVIVSAVTSVSEAGGMSQVIETARQHGRMEVFNTSLSIHERHTIFNVILMGVINFSYLYSFSQATIQRLATQKDLRDAKLVMYINAVGLMALLITLFVNGLGIFAVYAGCDPITSGHITQKDQMLPYYVMDRLGFLKGVPGVFVACLFSGTLSSISSVLNSLPTMLWVDFLAIIPRVKESSERTKTIATKALTLFLGVIMMALALLASKMGGLIQAAITVLAIVAGPVMGVFMLGVAVPICGKKGAMAGLLASIVFMTWLGIGAQMHAPKTPMLPLYTDLCEANNTVAHTDGSVTGVQSDILTALPPLNQVLNATLELISRNSDGNSSHPLEGFYSISYTLFAPIGLVICVLVALLVTVITGKENLEDVSPDHVLHCLRRYVGPNSSKIDIKWNFGLNVFSPKAAENATVQKSAVIQIETKPLMGGGYLGSDKLKKDVSESF